MLTYRAAVVVEPDYVLVFFTCKYSMTLYECHRFDSLTEAFQFFKDTHHEDAVSKAILKQI